MRSPVWRHWKDSDFHLSEVGATGELETAVQRIDRGQWGRQRAARAKACWTRVGSRDGRHGQILDLF